ncbi:MAG: translation elongation factor Ts [Lachnospiraceae bacterium]|nr:translation elongation factor Ts [Lachnospiraceae bacterium]
MAITAAQVKQLREMTGAGIMDCKKALTKTNGDMDAAVDELRKVAGAKVEKKASRIAAEGLSIAAQDGDKTAVVVEVNSETDFVASNEKFKEFVNNVAKQVLASDAKTVDELKKEKWVANPEQTVDEALTELIGVISEKLSIRRFEKVVAQNGIVASYVHGGGRIAVIVEADTDVVNDEIKEAVRNVAMQVAALAPKYVSENDIPQEDRDHELAILVEQAKNDPKNASKPQNIIEKMVQGRLNKEFKEVCLTDQIYVKAEDGKQTVAQYLAEVGKKNGASISLKKFVRFETGEGMEHREENFAEEVMAQAKAAEK